GRRAFWARRQEVAEREGFEPSIRGLAVYTLSRRAPSTTRTSLRRDKRLNRAGNDTRPAGRGQARLAACLDRARPGWHNAPTDPAAPPSPRMSYLVLARKWRPRRFAELVGQEHVVKALTNALETGKVHHAFLFTGTRGVGKTTIARIFAKSLNCERGSGAEPCGE